MGSRAFDPLCLPVDVKVQGVGKSTHWQFRDPEREAYVSIPFSHLSSCCRVIYQDIQKVLCQASNKQSLGACASTLLFPAFTLHGTFTLPRRALLSGWFSWVGWVDVSVARIDLLAAYYGLHSYSCMSCCHSAAYVYYLNYLYLIIQGKCVPNWCSANLSQNKYISKNQSKFSISLKALYREPVLLGCECFWALLGSTGEDTVESVAQTLKALTPCVSNLGKDCEDWERGCA